MVAVLAKELRLRMRGTRTPLLLTAYLGVLGLVCYLVLQGSLQMSTFAANDATRTGISLFRYLVLVQSLLIVFVTPATTATAISGERQRQTLDLLLVTRLSSLGITLGKLLAAISFDLLLLICSLPIFSLVFLFGGVGPDRVAEMFLLFVMVIGCLGSIGLLVSVLARRSNTATVMTYLIVLLFLLGLLLAGAYLTANNITDTGDRSGQPITAYLDPAYGVMALLSTDDGNTLFNLPFGLWQSSISVCAAITVICVALSAAFLRELRA